MAVGQAGKIEAQTDMFQFKNNLKVNVIRLFHRIWGKFWINFRKPVKIFLNRKGNCSFKLAHITLFSSGNAGDTVLSTTVRDLFNCAFNDISWQLFNVSKKVDNRYIQKLNKNDAIILGGHGLFLPDSNYNDVSNWVFACSEKQYSKIDKPIIVFAVGYNFFYGQKRTELFESNIRKLVEKSAFFGLRNKGSIKIIQSFLGNDELRNKIVYQPCPTMISRYIYKDIPPKKETKKIALNVAMDRSDLRMGKHKEIIYNQIALAMRMLSERGYEIYFVTHISIEISFMTYLNKYSVKYKFYDVSSWDAHKLMQFYNNMDVVIGMRGHGIWIPFGVNCHIISLGNQYKTKWFLEDIDALDWYIDIRENPENLSKIIVQKFIDIHEINHDATTQRLLNAQKELYKITLDNLNKIKDIIR